MSFWKQNRMHPSRSKECDSNNLPIIHSMKIVPTAHKKFDAFLMHYPTGKFMYQQEYALFNTI
jgi:hypothetical protein